MFRIQPALPERYTTVPQDELATWIAGAKAALGPELLVLGHHYQRDEVMRWADARGDSYGLSRLAAERHDARYVVFCGVHFMAESADILTAEHQAVVLPDLNAGCSMADMAHLDDVAAAWDELGAVTDLDEVVPVTYMNSSAALKAFVGARGGAVCTSSNADKVLGWALQRGRQVLFFPDQHLGRNTGLALGHPLEAMAVWDPKRDLGGLDEATAKSSTFLLWKGHCSVHQRFTVEQIDEFRRRHPDGVVIVHPECSHDVVAAADEVGSTERILAAVGAAPAGSVVAVGTEIHLVHRLAAEHPHLSVESLDPVVCPCSTMFRIDQAHLAWCLENLVAGTVVNQVTVDEGTATSARVALERMLELA